MTPVTIDCEVCGGSGWSPRAQGNGYDDVCGECIGGQVLTGWIAINNDEHWGLNTWALGNNIIFSLDGIGTNSDDIP